MFTPAPKTRLEILKEVFPHQYQNFESAVCRLHNKSIIAQDASIKGMLAVLRAGYGLDLPKDRRKAPCFSYGDIRRALSCVM